MYKVKGSILISVKIWVTYRNTFQIFLDEALKSTTEYFVMFSKIEMGTSQITEIVPVWECKGEGAEKCIFIPGSKKNNSSHQPATAKIIRVFQKSQSWADNKF